MPNRPEEHLHRQVADYLRLATPSLLWWHTPNGARMSKAQAGIHKALGMLAGVPDLIFICDGGVVKFIELKAKGRGLSDSQKMLKPKIENLGCDYAVCRSVEEVIETLREWRLA